MGKREVVSPRSISGEKIYSELGTVLEFVTARTPGRIYHQEHPTDYF